MKLIGLVLLCGVLVNCSTMKKSEGMLTGTFNCPEYRGPKNSWGEHQIIVEHINFQGTPVILEKIVGKGVEHKTGPYDVSVMVLDNQWRYMPFYRNKKLKPVKSKAYLKEGKVYWEAQYPSFVDHKGKKRKAGSGKGFFGIDDKGHMVSVGSHYAGKQTCTRVP